MKILKRILQVILIILVIGFVFRGWIYRQIVTYKSTGERVNYTATNENLISYFEENIVNVKDTKIEEIINVGLSTTSQLLEFTASKNYNNPNKLIDTKTANRIGYATFFSSICNYLLEKKNIRDWKAVPHKGQLYFLGVNVHQYFDSPFFKDHDFAIIQNKNTGEILAVDPINK